VAEKLVVPEIVSAQKRAAIVLASLDKDVAAKVMHHLNPKVMTQAVECIRKLGLVPKDVFEVVIGESLKELQDYSASVQGGEGVAVDLLSEVVGEQQAASMLGIEQKNGARFGALASRRADEIMRTLSSESIGVIAVVLRFLPSELASDSLALLDEETRSKVVLRLATADLPTERVIEQIEKTLTARLPSSGRRKKDDQGRIDSIVAILQRSPKAVADAMLEELGKTDPDLANIVRDQMFVFEDFTRLDDGIIRKVLQELETGILSTALRKASDKVRDRFFKNMSSRAADGLREEMEFAGKMPASEVNAAQRRVVQVAQELAERGEIKIGAQGEEYV